jgi:hypothetical protein
VFRRLAELADRLTTVIPTCAEIGYDDATTERLIAEVTRRTESLRSSDH